VLMSEDADAMKAAVEAAAFKRPLIYAATEANADDFGALAKDNDLPAGSQSGFGRRAGTPDRETDRHGSQGPGARSGSRDVKQALEDQVAIRRAALKDGNRAVGFPTITFPCEMASNLDMETLIGRHVRGQIRRHRHPVRLFRRELCSRCCWNA
jgi:acetyl-CoA decarbonylase/synthase complex subunit gamma